MISPRQLRARGILGINRRNAEFILPGNPRALYPRVDDKLATKRLCELHGIPAPRTFAVIERQGDIRRFAQLVGAPPQFVIKPCKGAEGRGIVVVVARDGDRFTTAGGERWTLPDLRYHLETLLAGLCSLGGQPDRILVEQRIICHPIFHPIAVNGTPDIRILLYRGVPIMSMVRLPTRASRGRANLHQGAIAAGLDLGTGTTFGGVCGNRNIAHHPDTGAPIAGVTVPRWSELLAAAMRLADVLELAYLGVDLVLDAVDGPNVLEANARPGLAIQLANRTGLLPRLRQIDEAATSAFDLAERRALLQRWQTAPVPPGGVSS